MHMERWQVSDTVHKALAGPSDRELDSLRRFYSELLQLPTDVPSNGPGLDLSRREINTGLAEGARISQQRAKELQAGDPRRNLRSESAAGLVGLEEITLYKGPPAAHSAPALAATCRARATTPAVLVSSPFISFF